MDTVTTVRRFAKQGDLVSFNSSTSGVEKQNDTLAVEVIAALGINSMVFEVEHLRITPCQPYSHYNSWSYNKTPTTPVDPTKILSFIRISIRQRTVDGSYVYEENVKTVTKPVTEGIVSVAGIKLNDVYSILGNHGYGHETPVMIEVAANGQVVPIIGAFKTIEKLLGLRITETGELIGGNRVFQFAQATEFLSAGKHAAVTFESLAPAFSIFGNVENALTLIRSAARRATTVTTTLPPVAGRGVDKVNKVITPLATAAAEYDPLALVAFRTFVQNTHRTIDRVRISAVFNELFATVKTKFEFLAAIEPFTKALFSGNSSSYRSFESAVEKLPTYIERRKAAIKSSKGTAFKRLLADMETVTGKVDRSKFPKTFKAIEDGEIPLSTFFRTGNEIEGQYFLLNDNWQLWESMLKIDAKTTCEIAKAAAARREYEKDLMSYFYFVTKGLPDYLRKHTGKRWKAAPKLVDSPSELNPPTVTATGTAKTRSALTPIVDNVKNTVIVPYASLAMPGRQVTYCYSHTYSVIRDGLSVDGNTATADLETKLNGRDDYGLMFFTLTGSEIGRGYPTFLIIFERLERGTRVHFHRTHPSRSKNGDANPIHNWIKTNYNWMVGNVNKDRIKAQQGDLAFVTVDSEVGLEFNTEVEQYDHHCFDRKVPFAKYTKAEKSNILGYVKLDRDTTLSHNEHDPRTIPAGTYEIRQCRSWEANPAGVWSLRID